MDETVTITKFEYDRLVRRDNWLACLEAAGVDNWQGWDDAIEFRNSMEEE